MDKKNNTSFLDVVDEFLQFADLNKNGFLDYAEYIKAMNASNEDINERQPILSSSGDNNEI